MSLSQTHSLAGSDTRDSQRQEQYFTPTKFAVYGAAIFGLAFGSYELANALNPSAEAIQVLARSDVKFAVYSSGIISFVPSVGFFASEVVNGIKNVLRRNN